MPQVGEIPEHQWEAVDFSNQMRAIAEDTASVLAVERAFQVDLPLSLHEIDAHGEVATPQEEQGTVVVQGGGEIALKRHKTWRIVSKFKSLVEMAPVGNNGEPAKSWQRGKITKNIKLEEAGRGNRLRNLESSGLVVVLPGQKPLQ